MCVGRLYIACASGLIRVLYCRGKDRGLYGFVSSHEIVHVRTEHLILWFKYLMHITQCRWDVQNCRFDGFASSHLNYISAYMSSKCLLNWLLVVRQYYVKEVNLLC